LEHDSQITTGIYERLDWRVVVLVRFIVLYGVGFWLLWLVRGGRMDVEQVVMSGLFALVVELIGNRGLRRSPTLLRSRLRKLYFTSATPDPAHIAAILDDSGESDTFEEHRRLLEYLRRGILTEETFSTEMRRLVDEEHGTLDESPH